jgi:hypothetical protein
MVGTLRVTIEDPSWVESGAWNSMSRGWPRHQRPQRTASIPRKLELPQGKSSAHEDGRTGRRGAERMTPVPGGVLRRRPPRLGLARRTPGADLSTWSAQPLACGYCVDRGPGTRNEQGDHWRRFGGVARRRRSQVVSVRRWSHSANSTSAGRQSRSKPGGPTDISPLATEAGTAVGPCFAASLHRSTDLYMRAIRCGRTQSGRTKWQV